MGQMYRFDPQTGQPCTPCPPPMGRRRCRKWLTSGKASAWSHWITFTATCVKYRRKTGQFLHWARFESPRRTCGVERNSCLIHASIAVTKWQKADSARRCRFRKSQQKRASDLDSKYVWIPKLDVAGSNPVSRSHDSKRLSIDAPFTPIVFS